MREKPGEAKMRTELLTILLAGGLLPAIALAQVNCTKDSTRDSTGKYNCNMPNGRTAKIEVAPNGTGLLERSDGSAVLMTKQPNGTIRYEDTNGKVYERYPQPKGKSTTFGSDGSTKETYVQPNGTSTTYHSNGTTTSCKTFANGNIQCK
jgi:antitoxin component YwqK of YwqJK toxin-antitoxin module